MEYRINLTDDTVEQLGRVLGEPVQELEQEILQKEETIAEKDEIIAEKQAIIDAFPTIESKNITANGTYSEEGKAYSPVVVNVPQTTVEALNVTQNGTYSEAGKAYSPVTVNVPEGLIVTPIVVQLTVANNTSDNITIYSGGINEYPNYAINEIYSANINANGSGSMYNRGCIIKNGKICVDVRMLNKTTGVISSFDYSKITNITGGTYTAHTDYIEIVPNSGVSSVVLVANLS